MNIAFDNVANSDWLLALKITCLSFGPGKRDGREVVFENPLDPDGKCHSFRFLPERQIFMDHHQVGSDMYVTPARFIAHSLGISSKESWKKLKQAKGEWIDNPRDAHNAKTLAKLGLGGLLNIARPDLAPAVRAALESAVPKFRELRSLATCLENDSYRRTTELRTALIEKMLENRNNSAFQAHPKALDWWKSRGFDEVQLGKFGMCILMLSRDGTSELERIANDLGWGSEERIASTLWRPSQNGGVWLCWLGDDYLVLFPCWSAYKIGDSWKYFVTGIRVRRTTNGGDQPKEPVLSCKNIAGLEDFPASLGFYCLHGGLEPISEDGSLAPEFRIKGSTVILTEGISDAIAGDQLFRMDHPTGYGPIFSAPIFVSTGQIQCAKWTENLNVIRNCGRLIIAFNDDVSKSVNTGQRCAGDVSSAAIQYGIKRVEQLPAGCLEGCNDLNDLLRKRLSEKASRETRGFEEPSQFFNFIEVNHDR